MNTKRIALISVVFVAIVGGFFALAWQRGALSFDQKTKMPRLNIALISAPKPSLDREITFPAAFPEDSREAFKQKVETLQADLKEHPEDGTKWLTLAIYYKTVGDYEGAIQIWKYLVAVNSKDAVSFHNL